MEVITHQKLTLVEKKDILIFLKVSRDFFGLYLCLYVTVADLTAGKTNVTSEVSTVYFKPRNVFILFGDT